MEYWRVHLLCIAVSGLGGCLPTLSDVGPSDGAGSGMEVGVPPSDAGSVDVLVGGVDTDTALTDAALDHAAEEAGPFDMLADTPDADVPGDDAAEDMITPDLPPFQPVGSTPLLLSYHGPFPAPDGGWYQLVGPVDAGFNAGFRAWDLDEDGDLDLVSTSTSGPMLIHWNEGGPGGNRWREDPEPAVNVYPGLGSIAAGDLDGDGGLDVAGFYGTSALKFWRSCGPPGTVSFCAWDVPTSVIRSWSGGDDHFQPTLGDLDGDGDLDLVICHHSSVEFRENTGTSTAPVFTALGVTLPGVNVLYYGQPALFDTDGDGDLDLIAGRNAMDLRHYRNPGDPLTNGWQDDMLAFRMVATDLFCVPEFADLDGDGAPELICGGHDGLPRVYHPDGQGLERYWRPDTLFAGIKILSGPIPAAGDVDGDGDPDLVVGTKTGALWIVENTGTPGAPAFSLPSAPVLTDLCQEAAPACGDLDGDGLLDLVIGSTAGELRWLRNVGTPAAPAWQQTAHPFLDGLQLGSDSAPALLDVDGDGNLDLLALADGVVRHWRQEVGGWTDHSDETLPIEASSARTLAAADLDGDGAYEILLGGFYGGATCWRQQAGIWTTDLSLTASVDAGYASAPAVLDTDGDGDLDLVSGELYGALVHFPNLGLPQRPQFGLHGSISAISAELNLPRPHLADMNGDGTEDLLVRLHNDLIHLYFLAMAGLQPVPADGDAAVESIQWWKYTNKNLAHVACDFDQDGDLDLLFGGKGAKLHENLGSPTAPQFDGPAFLSMDVLAALEEQLVGLVVPRCADLDGDPWPDLLLSGYTGEVLGLHNTWPDTGQFGFGEPFAALSAGGKTQGNLTVHDLDHDGDEDLLFGTSDNSFLWYENTGAPGAPLWEPRGDPWPGLHTGPNPIGDLSDLDGDGLDELVIGDFSGQLRVFDAILLE